MEESGQHPALGAKVRHPRLHEHVQRRDERRDGEHRWVAQLPRLGGGDGDEGVLEVHSESRGGIVSPPTGEAGQVEVAGMPLVDERAGDRAGAGVEILVGAPRGVVDVEVMQSQRDVSGRVGEVEADGRADGVAGPDDRLEIQKLTGPEVDASEHDGGESVAELGDLRFDVFGAKQILARSWCDSHHVPIGIAASRRDVRRDRVGVAREGAVLHQDQTSFAFGAMEGHQKEMEVHGERVHRDDFVRPSADHGREFVPNLLVVRIPGTLAVEVSVDRAGLPGVQHLLDDPPGGPGLESERVADEVGDLAPGLVARDVESRPKAGQGIDAVQRRGARGRRIEILGGDVLEGA